MAINTSTITQLISDFRALSQKDSISPESLGSRRKPRPQRFPQGQRRRETCRIGRRPPRNIVPTRAKLSLLKLCRVQPILCNTAPTAPKPSILSTSAARLFVPTRAERNLFRLCRVQPNLVHLCTNSHTTILSASRYQAFHDPIRLGKS